MKRKRVILLLLASVTVLAGCGKLPPRELAISAQTETMPEASDAPMEEMPDDNQGIIKF